MAGSGTSELDLVEKVFLKIVLSELDEQFQTSLKGFLCPILLKVTSENEQVRNKILGLLSHINKRLRSRPKVQLPLESLLNQYKDESLLANVKNFTIIYIKMGYQRADKETQIALIPDMFSCLTRKSAEHQNVFLQNILFHLNDYTYPVDIEKRKTIFSTILKDDTTMKFIKDYFLDFLLLPYNLALDMKDPSVLAPPSLSKEAYTRLKTDPSMNQDQIEKAKLGIIKFLTAEMLSPKEIICHLIVSSGDVKHSVTDKADHMIKTFSSVEMWQDKDLISKLLTLYQGISVQPTATNNLATAADKIRSASSIQLKLKIFPYLLKSRIATDLNTALCLQIIFGGLFGDVTNAKIKLFSIEFICNSTDNCNNKTMQFLAPLFKQALSRVAMNKKEDTKLRGMSFAGFSRLAKRCPEIFKTDLGLIQKILVILEEENELRISIQDALSTISHAFYGISGTNAKMMETLILSYAEKELPALRLVALQFANAAFPTTHVLSRYVCVLCSGDNNDGVREEANRGLDPSKSNIKIDRKIFYPGYKEVCEYFYAKIKERKSKGNAKELTFSDSVYEKLLLYINQCLHASSDVTEDDETKEETLPKVSSHVICSLDDKELTDISKSHIGRHIEMINDCLVPKAGHSLHGIALMNLLELIASSPERLSSLFPDKYEWLQSFISSSKESVRETAARLMSILICTCSKEMIKDTLESFLENMAKKVNVEEIHGSLVSLSFILSRYAQFIRDATTEGTEVNGLNVDFDVTLYVKRSLEVFISKLTDNNIIISSACCAAIGEIAKEYVLPLSDDEEDKMSKKALVGKLSSLLENAPESKVKEKAVSALGNICVGDPEFSYRSEVLDALILSSKIRQPELHFNVGEAMSCLAAGRFSQLAKDKWILQGKKFSAIKEEKADEYFSSVLQRIAKDCIHSSISHVRQAAVTWLLCIVKFSSSHPSLKEHVDGIQSAFIDLLSDNDDITQDIASRGLGLIYDFVQPEDKEKTVSVLVDRLMSGKRKKQVVEDNTEIFKPGSIGTDPDGGNLSTYKEICSLATSLNKPDLVYKFLNLANHNAIWNSRKGAAFGFLSISKIAGDQLKPYLVEIIPKLYRYQYDPNGAVRKSMTSIWSAIVPDGKKTVEIYIKEILDELLSNITSNIWRTRESCCLGLNDLVRTCNADDILDKLSSLWKLVFKVMDDIKESVRTAATILGKTIGRLSIRLCDVNQSKLGEKAVCEVLPVLLDVGLSSNVAEVKSLSLKTLLDVSKNAGSYLKPHIPKFVVALLESLSMEEPQYLNTLSLQLSQNQEAQEKLDVIRLSASKSSPSMEAIRYCVNYVDETVLSEMIPRICDLMKTGIGLGTKVGCATLIVQLTMHCKDILTPYAGKLLASLLSGMNDRNNQIKKSYANCIGHLVMYSKESSIEKLLNKLIKWYFEREDESVQLSCCWCVNAIGRYSPDKLSLFNTLVLPFIFITKQGNQGKPIANGENQNQNIEALWEEIWNNNTSGNTSAIKLYLDEIYTLIVPLLTSQSWSLRTKSAQAVCSIAETLGSSLQSPHLNNFLDASVDALQGRTWDGKENILKAISMMCTKCSEAILKEDRDSQDQSMVDKVLTVLMRECRKEKISYKLIALTTTTSIIETWNIDRFEDFKPILEVLMKPKDQDSNNDDDDEEEKLKKKKRMEEIDGVTYESLGKVWPDNKETQYKHFFYMTSQFQLLGSSSWKTQQHILKSALQFVNRTHWSEACTKWKQNDGDNTFAYDFLNSFVLKACDCVETTTYTSLKLAGVKFLVKLTHKAINCTVLWDMVNKFRERLLGISQQLSSSSDFNVSNNAIEMAKLINEKT